MLKKKRITLNDVAKYAGVSRSTASLVVQGSPKIKESTASKVLKAIEELGYVYDQIAANMRAQTSTTIGLIITDIGNPFFTDLLRGIHSFLEEAGFTVFLGTTYDSEEKQNELIARMLEHRVAGMIICPVSNLTTRSIDIVNGIDIPIVMAVRENKSILHDYVGINYELGAKMATTHLIESGNENIAFIGGNSYSVAWQERQRGYKSALENAGLSYKNHFVYETEVTREAGREAILKMMEREEKPSAIFCFNDLVAHGVVLGLTDLGVKVGEEISVVGFDNTQESSWYKPSLTTVSSFPKEMGIKAANLLQQRLVNADMERQRFILQPELVVRDSSRLKSIN